MGHNKSKEEKEEVIVVQNAAGTAHVEQLKEHAGYTNNILTGIAIVLAIGLAVLLYRMYKRCHQELVQGHLNETSLRRYASLMRRRQIELPDNIIGESVRV